MATEEKLDAETEALYAKIREGKIILRPLFPLDWGGKVLQFVVTLTSIKICSNYTLTRWRAGNGVIMLQICIKKGVLRAPRACGGRGLLQIYYVALSVV